MRVSEQIFRCYPLPEKKEKKDRPIVFKGHEPEFQTGSDVAREIDRIGAPHAGPMLLLDCETLTGAKDGQGLRFGYFQLRGYQYHVRVADATTRTLTREKLDRLIEKGLFYEPKNCKPEEIAVLKRYAKDHKMLLYIREYFIKNVLLKDHWVKHAKKWEDTLREPCLVIGHNLPFDLGCLAVGCGLARKDLYGGLSLVLQPGVDKYEKRVAIKKLGFGKHLFRGNRYANGKMRWPTGPQTKTIVATDDNGLTVMGPDGKPLKKRVKNAIPRLMELVHYLDTINFARTLLGPGPSSMKDLLRRLNVPKEFQKETVDYHGLITPEYIGYCRSDVENTWQIFKACRELCKLHGRSKAIDKYYSEASLGKAYFEDLGIKGFNEQNPAFDPIVLGCFMEDITAVEAKSVSGMKLSKSNTMISSSNIRQPMR